MTFDHSRKFGAITDVRTQARPHLDASPERAVEVSTTPFGHGDTRVQLLVWPSRIPTSSTGAVGVTDVGASGGGTAVLLTPAQARELAAKLTKAADHVEDRPTTGGAFSIGLS